MKKRNSKTSAIYCPTNNKLRVINISGKWYLQRHDGSASSRINDPWEFTGRKPLDNPPGWQTPSVAAV
jgi:hypothetical protein